MLPNCMGITDSYIGYTAAEQYLNVEDAKVCHGVLPPLWRAEGLVTQHSVKHHLNAKTECDDYWDSHSSKDWVIVSGRQ